MPAIEFNKQAIGLVNCPVCGWERGEVRLNRKQLAWVYCDRNRCQAQTREKRASDELLARMRPIEQPAPSPPSQPAQEPPMPSKPKRKPAKPANEAQDNRPARRTGPGAKPAAEEEPRRRKVPDGEDADIDALFNDYD